MICIGNKSIENNAIRLHSKFPDQTKDRQNVKTSHELVYPKVKEELCSLFYKISHNKHNLCKTTTAT